MTASIPGGWLLRDGALHREFVFVDFEQAFSFIAAVATVAESMNHHPDWSNSWNKVSISLVSHDVGRVTERDIALAETINTLL